MIVKDFLSPLSRITFGLIYMRYKNFPLFYGVFKIFNWYFSISFRVQFHSK